MIVPSGLATTLPLVGAGPTSVGSARGWPVDVVSLARTATVTGRPGRVVTASGFADTTSGPTVTVTVASAQPASGVEVSQTR